VQSWLDDVTFTTTRDSSTLFTDIPTSVFEKKIAARLSELDNRSNMLKSKGQVCLEVCELNGFNSYELFQQFILPSCIKYNIPVEQDGKLIKVGK
jgi:hypothetical protein